MILSQRNKSIAFYILSGFVSAISSLILLPLITKYYTPAQFSFYATNIAIQAFLVPVLCGQAPVMMTRFYHDSSFEKTELVGYIFAYNQLITILLGSIALLIIYFTSFSIFVVAWSIYLSVSLTCKAYERIRGNAKNYFYLSILEFSLIIGLSFYFIISNYKIEYLFLANAVGAFSIYLFYLSNVNYSKILESDFRIVLKYGISFIPYAYSNIITQYFERLIVPIGSAFGIYYFYEKFTAFIKLLITKANDFLSPKFVEENINISKSEKFVFRKEYQILRLFCVIGFSLSDLLYPILSFFIDLRYLSDEGMVYFKVVFIFGYLRAAYLDRSNVHFLDSSGNKISLITITGSIVFVALIYFLKLTPLNVIISRISVLTGIIVLLAITTDKDKRYGILVVDILITITLIILIC